MQKYGDCLLITEYYHHHNIAHRKAWLFEHSQHWIAKDTLDDRITEALDNPVELWNIPWSSDTDKNEAPPPAMPQLSSFPLPRKPPS